MTALVDVRNIEKSFALRGGGSYLALKGIDLEIRKGEFISLIGHSGCGKSTLLNMIAGLDLPTEGTVLLDGHDVLRLERVHRIRRSIPVQQHRRVGAVRS